MYNLLQIDRELGRLSGQTGGIFDLADLRAVLNTGNNDGCKAQRIISRLVDEKILYRFCRGVYVRENFNIELLSRKIDPTSFISLESILAKECIIGPVPRNYVTAISPRPRPKIFESKLGTIRYFSIADKMSSFAIRQEGMLRYAEPERAVLDVLYYYKKGLKLNFNLYTDMNFDTLDIAKIEEYLNYYQNKNFIGFVRSILDEYNNI